ncbi:branched-chain amino acid transaminase [Egicoccus halophilus]|uniref:Branched-chain-amino-acid aminotransferase n=1 Tax=Egicoccus halophilus TaxID=1670830 RepID=A0A8J3ES27_9ACTN|nr:branched-chain amino acid transaminase [Egicoccus halophilus]GGI06342.1 branched chain amino acid aminotransferase [Egicoccus halophilus]
MPFPTSDKIWMDGELVDWDRATVHVLTPTLHYGYGVFEGIRAYPTDAGPAVFHLRAHLERLLQSAKIYPPLDTIPYTVDELCEVVCDLIRVNGHEGGCYIRPTIILGYGEIGLNPLPSKPQTIVATWEWGAYLGEDSAVNGVRVGISSYRRIGKNTIPPAGKANGQYLNSSLAKVEALRAGYDEAIMLSEDGYVAEGTGENLFVVRDGAVLTPPLADGPLGGITRASVMTIARDLDIDVHETSLVRTDLYLADEVFLTGTAAELTPVREVDGRVVGPRGPVTERIQSAFLDAIHGRNDRYADWLTVVD